MQKFKLSKFLKNLNSDSLMTLKNQGRVWIKVLDFLIFIVNNIFIQINLLRIKKS